MMKSARARLLLAAVAAVGSLDVGRSAAMAGIAYWDINGTTTGAAGDGVTLTTATGNWDSGTANWNTDPDGGANGVIQTWQPGDVATFSAGSSANTATNSTVTVTGAQSVGGFDFEIGTITLTGGGTFSLTGTPTLKVGGGSGAPVIFNVISGTPRWTKTGTGTLDLRPNNTNTGGVTINQGAVLVGASNTVSQLGVAPTTYLNDWLRLNGGTVRFVNGTSIGSPTGNVVWTTTQGLFVDTAGGTFDSIGNGKGAFGTVFVGAPVSGTGTLTKSGANILVLQVTSPNFTGKFKITGGELNNTGGVAGDDTGFGAVPATFVPDAITLDCGIGGALRSSVAITIAANRGITLGPTGGQFDTTNTMTVNSVISGTGPLIKAVSTSTGMLVLNAANTYAGDTTVSVGTLKYGVANALPGGTGKGNVTVTTTVDLNGFSGAINGLNGTGTVNTSAAGTPTLTLGGNDQTASFSGVITNAAGTLSLAKTGNGTQTLAGTSGYAGTTTVSAGTLNFAKLASLYGSNPASWTAANIAVNSGATLAVAVGGSGEFAAGDVDTLKAIGTATGGFKDGSKLGLNTATTDFTYGSVIANTNAGVNGVGLVKLGSKTLTLSAANTYTGGTTVSAGTLVASNADALAGGSVNVADGAVAQLAATGLTKAATVSTIATNTSGKFDITNNSMVIRGGTMPLASLRTQIQTAYAGGAWTGAGVTSTTAAGDSTGQTAIGYATKESVGKTAFKGVDPLVANDILVKYTYYGDADLSGTVTLADFSRFLNGYQNNLTTWSDGDFDYNGVVNLDDFSLFLGAYQNQGPQLNALADAVEDANISPADQAYFLSAIAAVPEPTGVALLAVASTGLLRGRRRGA